ncbi:MAG: hypothetical protein ACHP7N_00770 [Caulobacterales bacterium]
MTNRTSLLGGAALGVLLAVALASNADAKPKHRAHHPAAAANSEVKSEIAELKTEVQSLEAWREQETSERQTEHRQDQQQLAQVQGQLADSEAREQKAEAQAQNEIATIPGEVKTEVAKAAPKPGWWANTQVSGRMYYDLTNINEASSIGNAGLNLGSASSSSVPIASGNKGHSPDGTNFDIKRFYVSVDHQFNSMFSGDITTDFTYDYATGATQLYLKKAYLQAKIADGLIIRAGAADMPWIPFDEDVYGYRYVENTLIDRTKFGTSADWGVHALGKFPLSMDLSVSYDVAVINGMGYKTPGFIAGANRSQGIDFEGRVNVNYKGFVAAIGGYNGKLGQDYSGGATVFHNAERFDALIAYQDKWFKLGGEYMWANADVSSSQVTAVTADNSDAYEIFGNINFTPQISIFGRYDWVHPKETTLPALVNTYYNIGISYEPVKVVDFALVYKHDQIDHGAFATQNFATLAGSPHANYDEVGVWGQFRW